MELWLVWYQPFKPEPDHCPLAGVFSCESNAKAYLTEILHLGHGESAEWSMGKIQCDVPMFMLTKAKSLEKRFLNALRPTTIVEILEDLDDPSNFDENYSGIRSQERKELVNQYLALTGCEWPERRIR